MCIVVWYNDNNQNEHLLKTAIIDLNNSIYM